MHILALVRGNMIDANTGQRDRAKLLAGGVLLVADDAVQRCLILCGLGLFCGTLLHFYVYRKRKIKYKITKEVVIVILLSMLMSMAMSFINTRLYDIM